MSKRNTYTVIIAENSLLSSHREATISRANRYYFDTKRELLEFCARAAKTGKTLHVAVHEYTNFNKGLAGCGKLLDFATYSTAAGLVLHGLTPERIAQLRRYIPQLVA